MNVFNKVTLQSLKKNKTRTVVTIIGIILSAAMICAVTTFASSIQDYIKRGVMYNDGDWHGSETNAELSKFTEIMTSGKVEKGTALQQLGYAYAEGCQNEFKPYIYLLGADQNTDDILPVHIVYGRNPENASEIMLPEHIISNGGTSYKIGDVITLELGERMLEGFHLTQNNPCYIYEDGVEVGNGEKLVVREARTYTVVGFYERFSGYIESYSSPGYTALTVMDSNIDSSNNKFSMYFKLQNSNDIYDFMQEHGLSGNLNTDFLTFSGTSQYSAFTDVIVSLCAIIIGLIMLGSVSLIYNAFAISVSERTKQFGLLSSIGATKKQLRKMVLFEALTVSSIGIPLGVLSGIAGIGITLMIIGEKFTSFGYPVDMKLSVSAVSVVAAVIVSLITVLISALIPSKRATKISAVEAIRQNADIKAKEKNVKTSKLTYKLFGLPGVLAHKHYKRSKKKYRTTIISLFMSIVLFVSAAAFGDYLIESVEGGLGAVSYDLKFNVYCNDYSCKLSPDELLEITSKCKGITKGVYLSSEAFNANASKEYFTEEALSDIRENDGAMCSLYIFTCFVNDSEFRSLVKENGLRESDYFNSAEPLAIAVDGNVVFDRIKGKYVTVNYLASDEFALECDFCKLEAKGKITDSPFYLSDSEGAVKLIYPMSMMETVVAASRSDASDARYEFYYTSSQHKASEEALKQTLSENGLGIKSLQNNAENREIIKNLIDIIKVFSYGFIALISLIAAANVFNTISTNIGLRRREFAMLKTVGMPESGFNKMMNYECLLYGMRSLVFGLPVSIGVTFLIYRSVSQGYETTFRLPWTAMGIAVLSVFAVVFAAMMYSMRKIKKDNPIDALKNENL